MLYAFGDVENPSMESMSALEDIVIDYVNQIVSEPFQNFDFSRYL